MSRSVPKHRWSITFVESLETRELLTTAVMLYGRQTNLARHVSGLVNGVANPNATTTSPLDALGVPTPHEVARRYFTANFVGNFWTGPGQTNLQALRTQIRGAGTSNQFRHANISVVVTTPTDPAASATGLAGMFDRNSGNTGNVLTLDLTAAPGQDPSLPPLKYTWTVDGASGGIYTGAVGQGTLSIQYGNGHIRKPLRAYQSGRAYIIFQGSISTTGLGNNTQFG